MTDVLLWKLFYNFSWFLLVSGFLLFFSTESEKQLVDLAESWQGSRPNVQVGMLGSLLSPSVQSAAQHWGLSLLKPSCFSHRTNKQTLINFTQFILPLIFVLLKSHSSKSAACSSSVSPVQILLSYNAKMIFCFTITVILLWNYWSY